MEKIIMKREWLEDIPVLIWKGVPLIRIGNGGFVTAKPMGKNIRTMEIAIRMAKQFAEKYDCRAAVTDDEEWEKAVKYLKTNFAIQKFIQMYELDISEVLLEDSKRFGMKHVLTGGKIHGIDETFHGFISDYDAKGETQPTKLIFFTIRLDSDLIEIVS